MLARFRSHVHSNVVGYVALFVALGGTGAYAANTIGSEDVIDDSLQSQDIKNLTIGTNDLAINSVFGSRIRDQAILSSHVVDDALTGADIAEYLPMSGGGLTAAPDGNQFASFTGDSITTTSVMGNLTPNKTMTLKNFRATADDASVTVTARVDGVDTILSCTVPTANAVCADPDSITVSANSQLSVRVNKPDVAVQQAAWYATLE